MQYLQMTSPSGESAILTSLATPIMALVIKLIHEMVVSCHSATSPLSIPWSVVLQRPNFPVTCTSIITFYPIRPTNRVIRPPRSQERSAEVNVMEVERTEPLSPSTIRAYFRQCPSSGRWRNVTSWRFFNHTRTDRLFKILCMSHKKEEQEQYDTGFQSPFVKMQYRARTPSESLQRKFCGPTLSRNFWNTPSRVMQKFIGAVAWIPESFYGNGHLLEVKKESTKYCLWSAIGFWLTASSHCRNVHLRVEKACI